VINGGFQNHLHLMYGLPNGFFVEQIDTSDILKVRAKAKKYNELEESLAAQILSEREEQAIITEAKHALAIKDVLRNKKINHNNKKAILLALLMMDD
jgi:hypothetical protein